MNHPHRFILQPYNGIKSRAYCPKCQHRTKSFKRYIDTETGNTLADHVGRCDREESCGYHYKPKEYFKINKYSLHLPNVQQSPRRQVKQPFSTLPYSLVKDSLRAYHSNNFVSFLVTMFGPEKARELAATYHIGTASHWPGATIFWQIDLKGRVRTGKIMLYNRSNCKRVKQPFNHIAWVHGLVSSKQLAVGSERLAVGSSEQLPVNSLHNAAGNAQANINHAKQTANCILPTANFRLNQCLFGEHLLHHNPNAMVCIVESEKTAIIASAYCPEFIWLAAGSINGLNADKCQVLKGRKVLLFPDVNAYDKWQEKATELNARMPGTRFKVSDALEQQATQEERHRGIDMADRWIADWNVKKHLTKN